MNRTVGLADRQDVLRQRVEVAHSAEPLDYFRLHLRLMLGLGNSPGYPKSRDTFVVRRLQDEANARRGQASRQGSGGYRLDSQGHDLGAALRAHGSQATDH